jgi:hypothetical protein
MEDEILYKYLDADGVLMMLYYGTLMFTNATQLNDPFDCHPVYIDIPQDAIPHYRGLPSKVVSDLEYNKGLNQRDKTYICSLSKVHDSVLMWSYYSKNTGICIGLDMEKTRKYYNRMIGLIIGCHEYEVQYRDIINGHGAPHDSNDPFCNLFATKAKEWKHEQEVRIVSYDPSPEYMRLLPGQDDKDGPIPWKTVRAFLDIGGECFESVYLGVNISEKDKDNIIKVAHKCNPDINIYQMTIDPKAFQLKEEIIRI